MSWKPFSQALLTDQQTDRLRTERHTFFTWKIFIAYFCCPTQALLIPEKVWVHSLCNVSVSFLQPWCTQFTILRRNWWRNLRKKGLKELLYSYDSYSYISQRNSFWLFFPTFFLFFTFEIVLSCSNIMHLPLHARRMIRVRSHWK